MKSSLAAWRALNLDLALRRACSSGERRCKPWSRRPNLGVLHVSVRWSNCHFKGRSGPPFLRVVLNAALTVSAQRGFIHLSLTLSTSLFGFSHFAKRKIMSTPATTTCAAGSFFDAASSSCSVCPLGHFCVGGERRPCPLNTYQPVLAAESEGACLACPTLSSSGAAAASLSAAAPAAKRVGETRKALTSPSALVKARRAVSADTGAGKTTQVPQLVLDDCIDRGEGARCSLVVTQPRRISAVGVAQRVAEERAEKIGRTVGYSIRGEAKRSTDTRILLCTTGVLLRRLQCDGELKTLSHVFVDEVHERDVATDFLLIVLRRLLTKRPKLKLILMSATLNAQVFADYFQQFNPYLAEIPGRAHPVQAFYLEDALALTGLRVDAREEATTVTAAEAGRARRT